MTDISDYALLADCHGAALVARDGAIDWCCMPRFDTGALFARLLDPDAGTCTLDVVDGRTGDRRYLDGTLVLETRIHAERGEARVLDLGAFLACSFWLAECLTGQGRLEDARSVYDRALATATDLGLYAEQIDPSSGQLLGNFPLVLTHLSHIHAALALDAAR